MVIQHCNRLTTRLKVKDASNNDWAIELGGIIYDLPTRLKSELISSFMLRHMIAVVINQVYLFIILIFDYYMLKIPHIIVVVNRPVMYIFTICKNGCFII